MDKTPKRTPSLEKGLSIVQCNKEPERFWHLSFVFKNF
jgi:hypothetical protein